MAKDDIKKIKNDIKSFRRVRRVVAGLITSFPDDATEIWQQEEFMQLCSSRVFLDKAIILLEKLLKESSEP